MPLQDQWLESAPDLAGLAITVWMTDESGVGVEGVDVEVALSTIEGGDLVQAVMSVRTDAAGFGTALARGDPFQAWPDWTNAVFLSAAHPDYQLLPPDQQRVSRGGFWFPTGCCETEPGAANYGVRDVAVCPSPASSRIAVREGYDGPVEWRDAGEIGRVRPDMGYLDADAMYPCAPDQVRMRSTPALGPCSPAASDSGIDGRRVAGWFGRSLVVDARRSGIEC
jgi:hypothetical protein